ncbi:MAG: copper chaperone PCu(A)C [Zoogloeaceae bacterium]|jgi:copper(I)-binding protein|nr:copper chaperone PCu(A)C [Zoogloeaceae bacterium]
MRAFSLLLLFLFLQTGWAQTPPLYATDAWVRATARGQQATGAFLTLRSAEPLRLVGVRSPLAAAAEIHVMRVDDDGVMRMRAIPWLDLPADQVTELKPGGFHIMLLSLRAPANAGQRTTLTLVLENAARQRQEVTVDAEIRALNALAPNPPHTPRDKATH